MKKKFAAVSLGLVLGLTNCTGVNASASQLNTNTVVVKTTNAEIGTTLSQMLAPSIKRQKLKTNTEKMNSVIRQLRKSVNRTWYVFGGDSPSGWDCSGLVLWTYKHFGIKLYHRAYVQKYAAKPHKYVASKVKPGDIVACMGGAHVGIASDRVGYMFHAPRPGMTTKEDRVLKYFSNCTYTRLVQTN